MFILIGRVKMLILFELVFWIIVGLNDIYIYGGCFYNEFLGFRKGDLW